MTNNNNVFKNIPSFIIGFTLVALCNNIVSFPSNIVDLFKFLSKLFLVLSMTAIGLKVSVTSIFNYGSKVFAVGMISFLIQIFIAIQFVT